MGHRPIQRHAMRKYGTFVREDVFARDNWTCRYCGRDFSGVPRRRDRMEALTVDHIIPLARGGSDDDSNLATACARCNTAKANRTVTEWRNNVPRRHCFGAPTTTQETSQ